MKRLLLACALTPLAACDRAETSPSEAPEPSVRMSEDAFVSESHFRIPLFPSATLVDTKVETLDVSHPELPSSRKTWIYGVKVEYDAVVDFYKGALPEGSFEEFEMVDTGGEALRDPFVTEAMKQGWSFEYAPANRKPYEKVTINVYKRDTKGNVRIKIAETTRPNKK